MAQIVRAIRIRSLSKSLVQSCSKDRADAPLIRPVETFGQPLSVDLCHGFWRSPTPVFARCARILATCVARSPGRQVVYSCRVSTLLLRHTRDSIPEGSTFNLLVSRHRKWFLMRGGTPRTFTPFRSLSLVGRRPVNASTLLFASSRISWWITGVVPLMCHWSRALYMYV